MWVRDLIEPYKSAFDTSILFLGETTFKKQLSLKEEFEDPDTFLINFHRPSENKKFFLPPWMFDYPDFYYGERNSTFSKLKKSVIQNVIIPEFKNRTLIPILLGAGINPNNYIDFKSFEEWREDFINQLYLMVKKFGLSLPFLFMNILKHFIQMISKPNPNYEPNDYKGFIFYENRKDKPLGIYDPLLIVEELIKSLDILWETQHELIRSFKMFRLQSLNIFQGKHDHKDFRWKNLIAYCGGRLKDGSKCGKNPLVLGQSKICHKCGKLICPECHFCSEYCIAFNERKKNIGFNSH